MCKADAKLPVSVSSQNFHDTKKHVKTAKSQAPTNPNMRSLLSLTWQNDAAACLDSLLGDSLSSVRMRAHGLARCARRAEGLRCFRKSHLCAKLVRRPAPPSLTAPRATSSTASSVARSRVPHSRPAQSSSAKMSGDTGAPSHATDKESKVAGEQHTVQKFIESDQMLRAAASGASGSTSSGAMELSAGNDMQFKSMDSSGHDVGMLNDIIFQKLQEHSAQQERPKKVEQPPASRRRSDSITGRKRSSSEIEDGESAFDCLETVDDMKVDDRVFLPNGKAFRTNPARARTPSPRTSTENSPAGSPVHSPVHSPAASSNGNVDMEKLSLNLMVPSMRDDVVKSLDQEPSKIDEFVARLRSTGAAAQPKVFLRGSGKEYITSDTAQAIAAALATNTTVRHLGIVGCGLTVPGAKVLADGLRANKSVVTLDFSRCGLTFPATIALIEALNDRTSSIHNLYMKGCGICDASAYVIAQRLSLLPRVRYMNLSQNRISKAGIAKLGCGIKANIQNGGHLRRVDH